MGPEHRSSKFNGPAHHYCSLCLAFVAAEAEPKRAAKAMLGTKRFVPIRVGFRCEAPPLLSSMSQHSVLQLNCSEFTCAKAAKDRYYSRTAGADTHAKAVQKRT